LVYPAVRPNNGKMGSGLGGEKLENPKNVKHFNHNFTRILQVRRHDLPNNELTCVLDYNVYIFHPNHKHLFH